MAHRHIRTRTVFITGGGSGIGQKISERLIEQGYDLVVHEFHAYSGAKRVQEFGRTRGRKVLIVRSDLRKESGVAAAVAFVRKSRVLLAGIVHCAGLNEKKPYRSISWKDYEHIFGVNIAAPIFLIQKLSPLLAKSQASMVMVGSAYSFIGGSGRNVLYTASKTALLGLTKSLALMFAPAVRVNAVVPGFVDSPMLYEKVDAAYVRAKKKRILLKRLTTADEVAAAVAFLFSEDAASITGQSLHVNGGVHFT